MLTRLSLYRPLLWVCFLSACGGGKTTSEDQTLEGHQPSHASSPIPVGTRGQTQYYEMRVSPPDDCTPQPPLGPGKDIMRIGVEVTLRALADVQIPANPYYALLVDGEGVVHEAVNGGCEPLLPWRLLTRGESVRGWLAFDIRKERHTLRLSYAPRLAVPAGSPGGDSASSLAELVFDLGR